MKDLKWVGILGAGLLIIASFMDWVIVKSLNLTISGVETTGTNFGKPAYLHWVFAFFFLLFSLIPKLWAKRFNLLAGALNLAWAVRNYFEISSCSGGECPEKQIGLYLVLASSIIMLIATFFPDMPGEKD